jgi:hypothetical protein
VAGHWHCPVESGRPPKRSAGVRDRCDRPSEFAVTLDILVPNVAAVAVVGFVICFVAALLVAVFIVATTRNTTGLRDLAQLVRAFFQRRR